MTSFPVDEIDGVEDLMDHELLLVGCPTWNLGADTERSGTDWDDLYYEDDGLPSLDFAGKKVAVFGLTATRSATAATSATRLTSWRASSRRRTRSLRDLCAGRSSRQVDYGHDATRKLLGETDQVNEVCAASAGWTRSTRATRPRRACRSGSTSWRARDSSAATPRLPQHPRPPPPRRHPRPRRSAPRPSRPSSTPSADCCGM